MPNPNRVVGQSTVEFNGTRYPTAGETTLEIGGAKRESVMGDYEAGAFKESVEPAKCDVTILYKPGVRLSDIRAIDDATVTVQLDTGVTWIMRNAYCAEVISFSTSDGKAKVVMQGPPAEEMV